MNINKLVLRIINPPYFNSLEEVFSNQYLPYNQLRNIQESKFSNLLLHCKSNVPYYREILKNLHTPDLQNITSIPVLTKELLKLNYRDLKATNLPQKRFKKNSTSGSTGVTTKFLSDRKTDVYRHACGHRGNSWSGWQFGEPVFIIWGALTDLKRLQSFRSNLVNSKYLFNTKVVSSGNLSEPDISQYLGIITKQKPSLIVGYPSSLEFIANYINNNSLEVHKPKGIITGGETLHEHQRSLIEKAFSAKVLNRYGCREVGHIANECHVRYGLHINIDHLIVEVVNEKGDICHPGELGEIVVTDLDNYAFPLIRYKIGDIGVLSDRECDCGMKLPLLERVEGRTFDIIKGSNGNNVLATQWTLFLKYQVKGIIQFQIIQKKIDLIYLYLVVSNEYNDTMEDKIITLFKEKLGSDTCIEIFLKTRIETTQAGKFRWIISEL